MIINKRTEHGQDSKNPVQGISDGLYILLMVFKLPKDRLV
jgi:hypothetical protein